MTFVTVVLLYFFRHIKLVLQFFLLIFTNAPSSSAKISIQWIEWPLRKRKEKKKDLSSASVKRILAIRCYRRLTIVPITVLPLQNLIPDVCV